MGPIDFSIPGAQDPSQALLSGLGQGLQLQQVQAQQRQALAQQAAQMQMQNELSTLAANRNATYEDYRATMTRYPQLAESLGKVASGMTADQQRGNLSHAAEVASAIRSGDNALAANLLEQRAVATETSGQPQMAAVARSLAKQVTTDPQQVLAGLMPLIASLDGGDKVISGMASAATQSREDKLAPAALRKANADATVAEATAAVAPRKAAIELANTASQINERALRLGLDRDKLTSDVQIELAKLAEKNGTLPEPVAKELNAAVTDSIAADASAKRMVGLASQIDGLADELGSGLPARAGEAWKRAFGTQNELTRIRSEFSRIVTPSAMAAYKQVASGSTSDKDIETAMIGVPKDTDSPERMSQFLRGAAKLQVYDSVLNKAKSEWFGAVRSLDKAKADLAIDGVRVPAGTTFIDFANQYVEAKAKPLVDALTVSTRNYLKYADPVPAAPAMGATPPPRY